MRANNIDLETPLPNVVVIMRALLRDLVLARHLVPGPNTAIGVHSVHPESARSNRRGCPTISQMAVLAMLSKASDGGSDEKVKSRPKVTLS